MTPEAGNFYIVTDKGDDDELPLVFSRKKRRYSEFHTERLRAGDTFVIMESATRGFSSFYIVFVPRLIGLWELAYFEGYLQNRVIERL